MALPRSMVRPMNRAMKNLLLTAAAAVAVSLLSGCASHQNTAQAPLLNSVCLVTGEAVDNDSPTSDYLGGKVGFCCKKCKAQFDAMDDAGKKAAFDAKTKQ